MTIRRYNPWDWTHWAVFLAGLAIFATVATLLQFATFEGGYAPPTWPAFLVLPAWCWPNWRLYRARKAYADRIVGWTIQGISLVLWNRRFTDEAHRLQIGGIGMMADRVARFWDGALGGGEKIRDYFNGLAVELVYQDGPLIDRRHGVVARGLTYPKRCVVAVDTSVSIADPTALAALGNLVGHELSHACLDALGIPQPAQEQSMKDAGCPWA
jgi:hypothetical protein